MSAATLLLTTRVEGCDPRHVAKGSTKRRCAYCGELVWISPSSLPSLDANAFNRPLTITCGCNLSGMAS